MITTVQAILLGALQGFTELFPISSLGHTVLLPPLLGWSVDQDAQFFIIFLVATHFATALVLLGFFFDDWMKIARGFFRSITPKRRILSDTYARLSWLIIVGTIPAGLLGLLFQKKFEHLFAAPVLVSLFLIGNGFLLYGAELLRRKGRHTFFSPDADHAIATLSYPQALFVGSMQALALFPGFSRTGAALAGGLLCKLDHESAARFSFLLATPLIFAAAALKLPLLLEAGKYPLDIVFIGFIVSGITAYFSIRFLTKYFKTKTLTPFALYCVFAGLVSLIILH
ncbi:MAG: undecaprenyl-diphosphate phosphatase [Patescibacteria group bacterium]|mgnify:CR=1 FL=1